jgi:hypothetical protein
MQPRVVFIELRKFCASFQTVQEIQLWVAPRSGEHQFAGLVSLSLPCLQFFRELGWDRNFSIFVRLRGPISVGFVADPYGAAAKFTSDQYVYITSCSRIPVIRKNSNHSRSSSVQALKKVLLCKHIGSLKSHALILCQKHGSSFSISFQASYQIGFIFAAILEKERDVILVNVQTSRPFAHLANARASCQRIWTDYLMKFIFAVYLAVIVHQHSARETVMGAYFNDADQARQELSTPVLARQKKEGPFEPPFF